MWWCCTSARRLLVAVAVFMLAAAGTSPQAETAAGGAPLVGLHFVEGEFTPDNASGGSQPWSVLDVFFDEDGDEDDKLSRRHIAARAAQFLSEESLDVCTCADPRSQGARARANQFLLETVRRL
jgi:hypothetical protein